MTSVRQSSFNHGEFAPEKWSAINDPAYATGLRLCSGFLPTHHGAMVNRPGTKLDARTKSSGLPYLRRFIFSNRQALTLEIGDQYIRFHAAGGPILLAGTPVEVATPYVIADVPLLDFSQFGDVITITHHSYQPKDLSRLSNTSWTLTNTPFAPPAGLVVTALSPVPNGYGGDTATGWITGVAYDTGQYAFDAAAATPACYIAIAPNASRQPSANAPWWALAVDGTHIPRRWDYVVTVKYKDQFGRNLEGLPCAPLGGPNVLRAPDRPISCQWTAPGVVAGLKYVVTGYGVYAGRNGLYGWVGDANAGVTSFKDDGTNDPDFSIQPPKGTNPFTVADGANTAGTISWPACSVFHEQRRVLAGSDARPQDFDGSATNELDRFDINDPVQATDTYQFHVSSPVLEQIVRMAVPDRLVLLSIQGLFTAEGSNNSALSPGSTPLVRKRSGHGSSTLAPIVVSNLLLYVTSMGNYVRDFIFDFMTNSFVSTDVTVYGRHLLDGHTITDWTYASVRYPVVWAVRDDGLLLSLTYDRDTHTLAWAQHPMTGTVHSVCAIPEGNEDFLYLVVARPSGTFIERMQSRFVADVRTCCFLDCALTFDGRNTGATTMDVTGASFNAGDIVTIAASVASFDAGGADIGDRVVINPDGIPAVLDDEGKVVTPAIPPTAITITAVTNTTHVTGRLETLLDPIFQAVATTKWGFGRNKISSLDHLDNQQVTVLADGAVQGPFTVVAGSITLSTPSVIATAGLSYNSDAELLDIASEQGRTSVKSVASVTWEIVASRGIYTGEDFGSLQPWKQKAVSDGWGPPPLATQQVTMPIKSSWNKLGRAVIRQRDPLPLTISAVTREVEYGGKGAP